MAEYIDNEYHYVKYGDRVGRVTNVLVSKDGVTFEATIDGSWLFDLKKIWEESKMKNNCYPGYTYKYLAPRIYDVKVYNDKAVKVFFIDGTTETAVCQEGDEFDLDMGITICVMKHILGRNEYFRMLKKAKKNAEAHREIERKSKEAVEIRKRQRAKEEARKKARRERRDKELATAIADAMNTKKKR